MKIIDQYHRIEALTPSPLVIIEKAGRICYKSEDKIKPCSANQFVSGILSKGHESVIEHASITTRFVTNRGVTHELVRHRVASFSQESTRYVRYDGNMEFIKPVWWDKWNDNEKQVFKLSCKQAESNYKNLLKSGSMPGMAREALPNSLKTEIIVTANFREWRHIFKLRCSKKAHPQIRALMINLRNEVQSLVPVIFDDV